MRPRSNTRSKKGDHLSTLLGLMRTFRPVTASAPKRKTGFSINAGSGPGFCAGPRSLFMNHSPHLTKAVLCPNSSFESEAIILRAKR